MSLHKRTVQINVIQKGFGRDECDRVVCADKNLTDITCTIEKVFDAE